MQVYQTKKKLITYIECVLSRKMVKYLDNPLGKLKKKNVSTSEHCNFYFFKFSFSVFYVNLFSSYKINQSKYIFKTNAFLIKLVQKIC